MKAQDALRLVKDHSVLLAVKIHFDLFFYVTGLLIYKPQMILHFICYVTNTDTNKVNVFLQRKKIMKK